jgi:hypothetical protein
VLREEGILLRRQRSWCVSTDPECAGQSADIIGLYLNPPEGGALRLAEAMGQGLSAEKYDRQCTP